MGRKASKPKALCAHCGKRLFHNWETALASVVRLVAHGAPPLRIYQCARKDIVVFHMTHRRLN